MQPMLLAEFSCLGADCPDTCCKGWQMPVDAARRSLYASHAPELLASIDAEHVMRRDDTGACVKFEDGLCGIQKKYGAEYVNDSCHFYPRLFYANEESIAMNAALSCPETLRLLFTLPDPLATTPVAVDRLPRIKNNGRVEGAGTNTITQVQAMIAAAVQEEQPPEQALQRIIHAAFVMDITKPATWVEEVPRALAAEMMPPPVSKISDPQKLLYGVGLLLGFSENYRHAALNETLQTMQQSMDCVMDVGARTVTAGADAAVRYQQLRTRFASNAEQALAPMLRRWLAAQLAMTSFLFGGFSGIGIAQRATILAVRFATIRLALMCHVHEDGTPPELATSIRVIGSIARLMDHLADAELSLMMYKDAGWLDEARLHGLILQ
jgi:hypothetical protein